MEKYDYTLSNGRILYACRYHIAWCPTFRRPVLTEPMRIRMKELIEDVCRRSGITILAMEIKPHRVYLYVDMPPMDAVNNMVRRMKRETSSVLCREFPRLRSRLPSLWTLHYFVSTEPECPEEKILQWMETQPRYVPKKTDKRKEKEDADKLGTCETKSGTDGGALPGTSL